MTTKRTPSAQGIQSEASIDKTLTKAYAPRLLKWYDAHGRHDLPWMMQRTPYRVWLSEIMLQQTQVATATPYFHRFVTALPDLQALANAELDEVLALWSGLGYYSRARNLHAAARVCMAEHGGQLPHDFDALHALPGIGRSTAGAILAQAWGDAKPILDGNVKRVLTRLHGIEGWPGLPAVEKKLWAIAYASLPIADTNPSRMADYTQAQMDLGATVCTRSRPRCETCPFEDLCITKRDARTSDIPARKPRKTNPQRETRMLWLHDSQGRTLLQRRPATGIWASLWSLPEAAEADEALAIAQQHAKGIEQCKPRDLPMIEHTFSHYKLRIYPALYDGVTARTRISDNDALRWVSRMELATLGIPSPVRKLIEKDIE